MSIEEPQLSGSVIAGLDPAIHPFLKMDARIKSGHDGGE
jgi:hypothetical protein